MPKWAFEVYVDDAVPSAVGVEDILNELIGLRGVTFVGRLSGAYEALVDETMERDEPPMSLAEALRLATGSTAVTVRDGETIEKSES